MLEFMWELREVVTVGVVGASDLVKITEQLGKTVIHDYDYVFSENGFLAHKNGEVIGRQSLKSFLGEDKLKEFINFTLHYIADLDIPIKRFPMRLGQDLQFKIPWRILRNPLFWGRMTMKFMNRNELLVIQ